MKYLLLTTILLLQPAPNQTWHETDWSKHLAGQVGGVAEYRLPNGARVDIYQETETVNIAWEVEWVDKWPESIGQSLFYSLSLDNAEKRCVPGIWLLKKPGHDEDYLECLSVVRELRGRGFDVRLNVQDVK